MTNTLDPDKISLRVCTPADVPSLKSVIHRVVKHCYPQVYPASVVKYFLFYHDSMAILANIENGYTVGLIYRGKLIATGNLHDGSIGGVYVLPEFQKKGLAKIIVNHLLEKARENGLNKVNLDSTLLAKKLYDSLGFTTIDKVSMDMEGGEKLDYYPMEKKIG